MKVTLDGIKAKIKGETYIVMPDGRTTVCQLTLENGFSTIGTSACVDPANFDMNIGRKIAFENAFNQIWPLEGYLLAEKLYWGGAKHVVSNFSKEGTATIIKPPMADPARWGYKKDGTPKARPGRKAA